MSKLNGNGHDRENVTSLDDARKRAAEKAKAAPKAGGAARGSYTLGQMLFGGLIIVMAIGYLVSLALRATTAINGGAA